jgi:hypothetical protein
MIKPSVKYRTMGNPTLRKTTLVPQHTKPHNVKSWGKTGKHLDTKEDGKSTLEELTDVVGMHMPPASQRAATQQQTNRGFILYCVDLGWLEVCR